MFFLLICWQQSFWNLMLNREQKGLTNLLRRHGIDLQKNNLVNKNAMKDKEYNMTHNDLGRWANIRLAFIKQHRSQLYQGLLKENKLHSYLAEFDR